MHRSYYIAPGTYENWCAALAKGSVWGLPKERLRTWRSLRRGDVVFFYVQAPFSGIVGYGEIQDTFEDRTPFFADDRGAATNWPLRFGFQVILASAPPRFRPRVPVEDLLRFPRLKRLEKLTDQLGEELLRRCKIEMS